MLLLPSSEESAKSATKMYIKTYSKYNYTEIIYEIRTFIICEFVPLLLTFTFCDVIGNYFRFFMFL